MSPHLPFCNVCKTSVRPHKVKLYSEKTLIEMLLGLFRSD
ncbi:hypothetical protein BVRB_3g067690 [Beta vulgaris subsp. vulgaris]|uniref:Uncharacterized protein n=1 Tax=Beta vulgaris subsp. vulgaris TaxID=3555 RepID=A0A0J8BBX6_BETVV|nr:hypothetical protein BVRB_3g067690 [Beta vulgaris subsp. vulgaris]